MRRLATACALLAACSVACGKTGVRSVEDTRPPAGGGSGAGGSSVGGGPFPSPPGETTAACGVPGPNPGPAPLSALSAFEINRSVRALLGGTSPVKPARWLNEEGYGSPFSRPPSLMAPSAIHDLAHDIAVQLSADAAAIRAISDCDPNTSGEVACAARFIESFLPRAHRRTPTKEDTDDMQVVFADGQRLGGDFASGVRAVVEVTLQGPDFLYLIETGTGVATGPAVELTGEETAARLAYFLTGSPPDAELAAVATQRALSADTVEEQARRLLGSPASRELVRHYYSELLRLGRETDSWNAQLGFTPEIAQYSKEESERFAEDITFDGTGTFRALLTEPSTWVNAPLAQFYGLPGVVGASFRKVALDASQRGGIFTQAGFLQAHSHSTTTSPVARGMAVLVDLLCVDVQPPPPDVDVLPTPASEPATNRQRLTLATQAPTCQTCHRDLDPLGFAFEHYDAVGKWQDSDNGVAVDTSGTLAKTDAGGQFADALELMQHIAESDDAKGCFVQHWLAQAYRRVADANDACAVAQVSQGFADRDGNLVELLLALAKTDHFRYRLKSELAP